MEYLDGIKVLLISGIMCGNNGRTSPIWVLVCLTSFSVSMVLLGMVHQRVLEALEMSLFLLIGVVVGTILDKMATRGKPMGGLIHLILVMIYFLNTDTRSGEYMTIWLLVIAGISNLYQNEASGMTLVSSLQIGMILTQLIGVENRYMYSVVFVLISTVCLMIQQVILYRKIPEEKSI